LNAVARGEKLTVEIEVELEEELVLDFTPEDEQLVELEFIRVPAVVVKEKSERQSQSYGLSM
jgi:hypothetical protein